MTPVPSRAISKAIERRWIEAPDSFSWSCIFFSIFLAATIAGWYVTVVGVVPSPSIIFSDTDCNLLRSGPSLFWMSPIVSPGFSLASLPNTKGSIGVCWVTLLSSAPAFSELGSMLMCTASATPSGNTVGSTVRGNLLLPKSTSTICP